MLTFTALLIAAAETTTALPAAERADATSTADTTPSSEATVPESEVAGEPIGPSPNGVTLAMRLGYGIPMGNFANSNTGRIKLSDEFSGQIPFWLEIGYRFAERFLPALYLSVGYPFLVKSGPGLAASECHVTGVSSCSGNASLRYGLEFLVKPWPHEKLSPWLGIGTGYESTQYTLKDQQGGTATVAYKGWEMLNLQLGADYYTTRNVSFGPYAVLSLGRYSTVSIASGNEEYASITIGSKLMHQWLQFGLKGTVDY